MGIDRPGQNTNVIPIRGSRRQLRAAPVDEHSVGALSLDNTAQHPEPRRLTANLHGRQFDCLLHPLPDRLRLLTQIDPEACANLNVLAALPAEVLGEVQPSVVADGSAVYALTLFPLATEGRAALIWVQLDLPSVIYVLSRTSSGEETVPFSPSVGVCANLLWDGNRPVGLHATVTLRWLPLLPIPCIAQVHERGAPFSGLSDIADVVPLPADRGLAEAAAQHAARRDIEAAALSYTDSLCARSQQLLGEAAAEAGNHLSAYKHFRAAAILDHPHAADAAHLALQRDADPLRARYPELFEQIRRGDRLRALTTLRAIAPTYPLHGNAILSYCLRPSSEHLEGLGACERSLACEADQSDVLDSKCAYLLALGRDGEFLETAEEQLRRSPREARAVMNLIDALLLHGMADEAIIYAHRYQIVCANLQLAWTQLFKCYEAANRWTELGMLFDLCFPLVTGPTPDLLCLYGETLVECGRFEESRAHFEHAMMIEPGNAKPVLGLARALARADREAEAAQLLRVALADPTRIDSFTDRAFLATLLCEIGRRTGDAAEALAQLTTTLGSDLLAAAERTGPLPALEAAECLIALGDIGEARKVLAGLSDRWPEDPFVQELAALVSP